MNQPKAPTAPPPASMTRLRFINHPCNKPRPQNSRNGTMNTMPMSRPQLRCTYSQKKMALNPDKSRCSFTSVYCGMPL